VKKKLIYLFIVVLLNSLTAFAQESGENYFVYDVGHGIKYHVTDTYDNLDCNVWGVIQCNDTDSFLVTLNKEGSSGSYFSDSTLTGRKSLNVDSKELILFQSGCPVANQANFYSKFSIQKLFDDNDVWTISGFNYSVQVVGTQTINGHIFTNCIRISISSTDECDSEYLKGAGFFIVARDIGIVQLDFNRAGEGYSGTTVRYEYVEENTFTPFTLSGNVVDASNDSLPEVLVQVSNCNGCIASQTNIEGFFSLSVYGPDVVLRAGYDLDGNSAFDSFESGYYATKKISTIGANINNIEIVLPIEENYELIKEWGGQGGGEGFFNYPTGIAVDKNGYIYVVDTLNDRVQKFKADGSFDCSWGESGNDDGQFSSPIGIAVDSQGFVYVAGGNGGNIQKFTSTGNFVQKWSGLSSPCGIALDPSEQFVYVTEERNDTVQKFDRDGNHIKTFGATGTGDGEFDHPSGIATDVAGNVYVVDINNSRIQKLDSDGVYLDQISLTDNFVPNTSWPIIYGIHIGVSGEIYFSNYNNGSIDYYSADGAFLSRIGTYGEDDGELKSPNGIAFDANGNMYVADMYNYRFQKFAPDESFMMAVGSFGGDGDGYTNKPVDCEAYEDETGDYLYVLEFWNCRIQKFDSQGNYVSQWGTIGSGNGEFRYPEALALDAVNKRIYVSDSGNRRVQKFDLDGNYISQWGSSGTGDGQFIRATGVAVNSQAGFVYVADCDNPRVQKFDLDGNYINQWGSSGTNNGQFVSPRGIAVDSVGHVYVSDESVGGDDPDLIRVQKFDSDGNFLKSFTLPNSDSPSTGTPRLYDLEFDEHENLFVCCTRRDSLVHKFYEDLTHVAEFGDPNGADSNAANGLAVDSSGFVYICDNVTNKIYKYMKTGNLFVGSDYLAAELGQGIKYRMTDTYNNGDCNVWAVNQCDSQEEFLLTLTSESSSGTYFRDSALTGKKNLNINGRNLIFFQSGCPVGNQANYYRMFSLPTFFHHGDNWEVNGVTYSVEVLGSTVVNGKRFDDCIKVAFDSLTEPSEYLNGAGFFIIAKGLGIINLEFTRKAGDYVDSKVIYQYLENETFAPYILSGMVTDLNDQPLENILVQLSNCNGCLSDVSDSGGNFSLFAYGPDIVLRAGYDNDHNNVFDSFGVGYFNEHKVGNINGNVNGITISGFLAYENTNPPEISITNPVQGDTISGTVLVQVNCDVENTKYVEFYVDGVKLFIDNVDAYEYSWDTTDFADGSHSIRVVQFDKLYRTNEDTIAVSIDNETTSTKLNLLSPNGGEFWLVDSMQEITWSSSGIDDNLRIEYSSDGGQSYHDVAVVDKDVKSYLWTVADAPSGHCKIKITEESEGLFDVSLNEFVISTCTPPWEIKSGTEHNMIIQGTVYKDGTLINASGYFLGGFGPGGTSDCRSVSEIQSENGSFYATVVGDTAGEIITFKLYECSTGDIFNIEGNALFKSNDNLNGVIFQTVGGADILQECSLVKGWNWISFNRMPTDSSFDGVFLNIIDKIEQVKTQYHAAVRVGGLGGQWKGDLKNMDDIADGKMFKIKVSSDCSFQVLGSKIDESMPIHLVGNWNWPAYLPSISYGIRDAIDSVFDTILEVKEQVRSAIKSGETMAGDLEQMSPGQGYIMKVSQSSILEYPERTTGMMKSIPTDSMLIENITGSGSFSFPVPIEGNQSNMIVMGTLQTLPADYNQLRIYAFGEEGEGDCRCVGTIESDGSYFLTIRGSDEGEDIFLKLYDTVSGSISLLSEDVTFEPGTMLSSVTLESSQPVKINNSYYDTLKEAFEAASDGDVIQMQEHTFSDSVFLGDDGLKLVTVKSGYKYDFSSSTTSGETKINGGLTVSNGANIVLDYGKLVLQ